jgi:hypothetical protein
MLCFWCRRLDCLPAQVVTFVRWLLVGRGGGGARGLQAKASKGLCAWVWCPALLSPSITGHPGVVLFTDCTHLDVTHRRVGSFLCLHGGH